MGAAENLHPDLQGLLGQTIAGRYRIDAVVGEGGMGAVFRGHHLGLKRDVAIKVLHPEMVRDAEICARFDREAHSASRLDHPNCLQVTDVGTTERGLKFMVMQLLQGHELADLLGRPIAVERSLLMMLQVLRGLEHAHEKGVIHRDIKPENIFITSDHEGREVLKLVDFGIAKLVGGAADGQRKMTKAGLVFGTPAYMSPEQALGQDADARADLYSAGIILYEMINGTAPFRNDDPVALVRMQVTNEPPELPEHVPQPVVDFIWKLLAKQRNDRFQSATEAREALEIVIQIVVPAEVIIAAGFASSASGPLLIPGASGMLHLPVAGSSPLYVPPSGPIHVGASGPIRLRSTTSTHATRPPHERAQTLGRLAMEPPPPGVPVARRGRAGWIVAAGLAGAVALAGAVMATQREDPEKSASTPGDVRDDEDDAADPQAESDAVSVLETDGPDATRLAELDRLILAGRTDEADKLLGPLLDEYPDDAQLMWRQGRLLGQNRKTRDKALLAYGRALDLDPMLVENRDFYAEISDLLRIRKLREEALDIALRKMGSYGHTFLLELVNNERRPLAHGDRHRALDELGKDPANQPLVNWRLNKALDLLQATQSLTPCTSYAAALEVIAAEPDAWYLARVEHAPIPVVKTGDGLSAEEKADAAACEALDVRRANLIAVLSALEPAPGDTDGAAEMVIEDEDTGGAAEGGEPAPADPAAPAPAPAEPAPAPAKSTSAKKKKSSGGKKVDCSKPFMGLSKKCR
jgi:serine/threonine protein kinase